MNKKGREGENHVLGRTKYSAIDSIPKARVTNSKRFANDETTGFIITFF
jgi:hypothetical protein